jgi:hypothetical protein
MEKHGEIRDGETPRPNVFAGPAVGRRSAEGQKIAGIVPVRSEAEFRSILSGDPYDADVVKRAADAAADRLK